MLFSSATTSLLFLLSSALIATAAPLPRAAPSGLVFPASVDDDGKAFGIKGKFRTKTAELRQQGDSAVLVGKYPEGSYAGSKGKGAPGIAGFIFSGTGGADLKDAKEATLTYDIQFQKGFDFALAGKIPGLYGGDNDEVAGTCAGGRHSDACWSARLMWREKGEGELYGYLPSANMKLPVCKGKCDVKYGASLGTGKWTFKAGKWATLTERVKLNDVGKSNGEIEVSVDGVSKILVKGLQLRSNSAGKIRGIMIHTFFGGSSSPNFASKKDQEALFRNIQLKVTETFNGAESKSKSSTKKKDDDN
jgi:hypothetical protein